MKPVIKYIGNAKSWRCFSVIKTPGKECYIIGEGDSPIAAFNRWLVDYNTWKSISDHDQ